MTLFVDVDGVLNANWHGASAGHAGHSHDPDPALLGNLAELVAGLEARGFAPRLVLSSTWRSDARLLRQIVEAFAATAVAGGEAGGGLSAYWYASRPGDGDAATPNLGDGSTPEGRAAEIRAWLRARPQQFFLVLDDLDVRVRSDGTPNPAVSDTNFVHTAELKGAESRARVVEVGLTRARVAEALAKVNHQETRIVREQEGTGEFSGEEWERLRACAALGPSLGMLKKDTCPLWIKEAARAHLAQPQGGDERPARRCCCVS